MITEPTSAKILTATAGALTFRIEVAGRSAHGVMRKEGVSAFEAFLPIHAALLDVRGRAQPRPRPAVRRRGALRAVRRHGQAGEWSSNVPDRLVAEGRFGVQLDEDPRLARARFEDVVNEVAVKDPWLRENRPVVTWPGGQFASGSTDADHPLIGEMSDGRRRHRRRAPAAGRRASTAATCGSTPASAASRPCTTGPATSPTRTRRWRRSTSTSSSRSPAR